MYNWEYKNWPNFIYNEQVIGEFSLHFAELTGLVSGIFNALDNDKQQSELISLMISEALKTSAIEGEMLSIEDLMSSIRNRLGLNKPIKNIKDKRAENVAQLLLQVRENYSEKLTEKIIKKWHQTLFSGSMYINAGAYRKGKEPMQIVSGAYDNEKIHYQVLESKDANYQTKVEYWENGII